MKKLAKVTRMWAPIINSGRAEWPAWHYIRSTRREAKKAWLDGFEESRRQKALENVRFARVTIVEEA